MKEVQFNPAKRSLGQNFLIDEQIISRIVDSLGNVADERVVEIGPGRGALTDELLARQAKLTVIEKDTKLAETWRANAGVHVIASDFLKLDLTSLDFPANLIGNLPYNISTAILERVAEIRESFPVVVFMFQREVAERIAAQPSTKERGYLSVISQAAFDIERLFDVPPDAFRPRPKVWSTVIRLTPRQSSPADSNAFRKLVSLSFRQKRKTLSNNLKASISDLEIRLDRAGIDGMRRAETLSLDEWLQLHSAINSEAA